MITKPVVVISKCITFSPVRWDGTIIASDFVEKLKPHVQFIPVCPEVEIGLGVPRSPIRLVIRDGKVRLIQPSTGFDLSKEMEEFSEKFLGQLKTVDGFILKSASPSSGFKNVKIYPTTEKSASIARGPGFFGGEVIKKYPNLAIEDERRLLNPRIREHFLVKVFTFAKYREIKHKNSIQALIKFQSENKYLLTAYNQKQLRVLGNIVANQEKRPIETILNLYENNLYPVFSHPPGVGSNINVLLKIMGYFSNDLTKDEKAFFLKTTEQYKKGKLPLSSCKNILRSWIIRFKNDYLSTQTYLEPYPEELVDLDSYSAEFMAKEYWK
jgi:uncharacterized protein YbgA (DUF1722 family)/uncharacterized protein YbbK (DUF523 family)